MRLAGIVERRLVGTTQVVSLLWVQSAAFGDKGLKGHIVQVLQIAHLAQSLGPLSFQLFKFALARKETPEIRVLYRHVLGQETGASADWTCLASCAHPVRSSMS